MADCHACGVNHQPGTACVYPADIDITDVVVTDRFEGRRWSHDLQSAEATSRQVWAEAANDTKAGVLCLVRETLLRLLVDPSWVPLSMTDKQGGRLYITFTVDLAERDAALARAGFMHDQRLRDTLTELSRKLASEGQ